MGHARWGVLVGIVCACGGSVGEPTPEDVGKAEAAEESRCSPPEGDISSSPASLFEAETMVAHANDGSIVAVWISDTDAPTRGGVQSIGYRVFRPNCHGWGPVQLLTVPGAFYHSDPTVVANDRGEFFLAFLAASGPHPSPDKNPVIGVDDIRIYAAKLPRGAASVEPPVLVSQTPTVPLATDKPWIALSPRGKPVISYTQLIDIDAFTAAFVLARSPDDGRTWTESTVDGSGFASTGQACTPRSGGHRVYVANFYFPTPGGGGGDDGAAARRARKPTTITPGVGDASVTQIQLHWSDDDGVTFRPEDVNAWPIDADLVDGLPSCDARGDDVWLAAHLATDDNFDAFDLHVGRFANGGATFAEDVVPPFSADTFFYAPAVVAGIHEGLDLIMMNFTLSGDGEDGQFLRIHSRDRGRTWSAPEVLATGLSFGPRHDLGWLGDYFGGTPTRDGGLDVTFPKTKFDPATGEIPQHVSFFELDGHHHDDAAISARTATTAPGARRLPRGPALRDARPRMWADRGRQARALR